MEYPQIPKSIKETELPKSVGKMVFSDDDLPDYSLYQKVIIIRHGATNYNGSDLSRGWKDIPLADEGIEEAKMTGERLKYNPPDCITTSDLDRAQTTANIISEITDSPITEICFELRTWDEGDLVGKEQEETLPIIMEHVFEKPDEALPNGESFNEFKERVLREVQRIVSKYKGSRIAIVTHHRCERLIEAWVKNGQSDGLNIDKDIFLEEGLSPGKFKIQKLKCYE